MATLDGGGGRSTVPLYHPLILIHASQIIFVSEESRESTVDSASAALWHRYSCRLALIMRLSVLELLCSSRQSVAILVLMRRQVSGDIHA